MNRRLAITISLLLGLVLGAVLAFVVRDASEARAQPAADEAPMLAATADVAIAPGPGGMWIVYGNRLRVCVARDLPAGVEPFTPECGDPIALY